MVVDPGKGLASGLGGTTVLEMLFWVLCYGGVGVVIDSFRARKRREAEGA
jgi:hypothetical protein